jgi:hypothetical protein
MSWKASVNEDAAKTTISPETGAAVGAGAAIGPQPATSSSAVSRINRPEIIPM